MFEFWANKHDFDMNFLIKSTQCCSYLYHLNRKYVYKLQNLRCEDFLLFPWHVIHFIIIFLLIFFCFTAGTYGGFAQQCYDREIHDESELGETCGGDLTNFKKLRSPAMHVYLPEQAWVVV